MKRLGDKVRGYMEHFSHRQNAECRHILFVLPTVAREHHLHAVIGNAFVLGMLNCCDQGLARHRPPRWMMDVAGRHRLAGREGFLPSIGSTA